MSRRQGDDAWRFRKSCPDVLRAGPISSHAWSEKRITCNGPMLQRLAHDAEDLCGLVGVAASTKKGPRKKPGPGLLPR
jgi:hypothetical protein